MSVGGGIGSFVTVDYLRIGGVPTGADPGARRARPPVADLRVPHPGLPDPPRRAAALRLGSRPDNIWGFPSYGFSEGVRKFNLKVLWQVCSPSRSSPTTTRRRPARSSRRWSARRTGSATTRCWPRAWCGSSAGGTAAATSRSSRRPRATSATKRVAFRSQYVHLAVGYPGLRFLPDLQAYRTEHNDYHHIVNAYESHEHVYERLMQQPSTVLVRGGGIVASRVLQRLMDDRLLKGARPTSSTCSGPTSTAPTTARQRRRRPAAASPSSCDAGATNGWAYQGFNYPKSVWGGQLKQQMRRLEGEQRAELYKRMGGTNTP